MKSIRILLVSAAAVLSLSAEDINLTPHKIPGTVRTENIQPSAGYGSSTVQAQLRINVKDGEQAIRFVRNNTDPFVVTKLYHLKHAEPYAMRG